MQVRAVTVQAQPRLSVLMDEFPFPDHLLLDELAHLVHAPTRVPCNLLAVDRIQYVCTLFVLDRQLIRVPEHDALVHRATAQEGRGPRIPGKTKFTSRILEQMTWALSRSTGSSKVQEPVNPGNLFRTVPQISPHLPEPAPTRTEKR